MDNVTAQTQQAETVEGAGGSLPDELRELTKEARAFAEAEFAYQKTRATYVGKESAKIGLLALFAGALIFFSIMALVFGSVIALVPELGAWGAAAAVMGGLVAVALVSILFAYNKFRRIKAVISEKDNE